MSPRRNPRKKVDAGILTSLSGRTAPCATALRRRRGALPDHTATVKFEILEAGKRPVSACADYTEIRDVIRVEVKEDSETSVRMLFDPNRNLDERIIKEQFTP